MTTITFALLREGSSDDGLIPHLRTLLHEQGASVVLGTPRDYVGSTAEKLSELKVEPEDVDLIFVHRDADSTIARARQEEIYSAASATGIPIEKVIPVTPIQEMEAWLLTSESEIRRVVGRPNGKASLGLPAVARIESTRDPKSLLKAACLAASETSGKRRQREIRMFAQRRATLLERMEPTGAVSQLSSWRQLVADVEAAYKSLTAGR